MATASYSPVVRAVTEQLKKKERNQPGSAVFFYNGNKYTAGKVLWEIENETDFGKLIIDEIIKTATDMFVR